MRVLCVLYVCCVCVCKRVPVCVCAWVCRCVCVLFVSLRCGVSDLCVYVSVFVSVFVFCVSVRVCLWVQIIDPNLGGLQKNRSMDQSGSKNIFRDLSGS